MANQDEEYVAKIVTLGDSAVGKTNLLLRFTEDKFTNTYSTTIGVDFKAKTIDIPGQGKIRMQIWDTAGQERFRVIVQSYYQDAHGVLLCYSLDNRDSFSNVKEWLQQLRENANPDLPIILLANKVDLPEKQVSEQEGQDLANSNNLTGFLQTSAKENINVQEAFNKLAEKVYQNFKEGRGVYRDTIKIDMVEKRDKNKGKKCCNQLLLIQRQIYIELMKSGKKFFIGGNWKSNNTLQISTQIISNVYNKLQFDETKIEVIAAPVFIHIPLAIQNLQKKVKIAAQNCSIEGFGAYTGEISANHLQDLGLEWVILGHSERRQLFNENNEDLKKKVQIALQQNLKVIFCIGETKKQRDEELTFKILDDQLQVLFQNLKENDYQNIVLAYEPVWAIGTGVVATTEQAQEVHQYLRDQVEKKVSKEISENLRIIYGGSVSGGNSSNLISQKDIDGFLVGGASLKEDFIKIVDNVTISAKQITVVN